MMENMQQSTEIVDTGYMKTLMEGERRVHTTLLFASPPNIN
jgi:hypothetical protein